MKDKITLTWLYQNSKKQLLPLLMLIIANVLFMGSGLLFVLAGRGVIDSAVAGERDHLIMHGIGLFAVIAMQLILRIFCRSLEVRLQGRLEINYKTKLLRLLLNKDYSHTSRYHSGELMNRLTGDITVVTEGITTIIPDFAGLLTKLIGALTVLCIFDPAFTLIFLVVGLLLFFITKYFRGKLKYLHKNVQEKDGRVRSFIQELLESLVVVKTFGAEYEMENKTGKLLQGHYKAKIRKNAISTLANTGFSFTFSVGYLYALVWSALKLMDKAISFGTLTAILQLVGQVQSPFAGLSGILTKVYGVIASAERMIELEKLPDEPVMNLQEINITSIYSNMSSIRLENISFHYNRDKIFEHVDFSINKGDFIVVTGRSGIGKSTLLLLLLGIFIPTEGTIGIKLNSGEGILADRHTRKLFAYVPQGNLLLSGTIRESIAFAGSTATDEEIMSAAQISCAAEFIKALPQGLDTVIGEKGLGLSEGQIQRLAIARAILCGAPILLLDESTSALDEDTEKTLLQNIREITDKTCLIISHRKAVFSLCNKEIHIEDGKLVVGERDELFVYHTA